MMMRAIMKDGRMVELIEDHGQRVLYALASIAATPLVDHINVVRLEDEVGEVHWPAQAINHVQKSRDAAD